MEHNIDLVNDPARVTQAYGFDEKSKMITVTHYINLKEGEDAYLESIHKYSPDRKKTHGTLFLYRIKNVKPDDEKYPYLRSKKFPLNGYPYRLSNVPHQIRVDIEPI